MKPYPTKRINNYYSISDGLESSTNVKIFYSRYIEGVWNDNGFTDYIYESLSPEIFDECLKLVRLWASEKGIDIGDSSESDYYMIKRIFERPRSRTSRSRRSTSGDLMLNK